MRAIIVLNSIRNIILGFIDFFYPPFRKWLNPQTFRYLACGGFNVFLDTLVYYLSYHYIFHEHSSFVGKLEIHPYISAFMMSFSVSFPAGFLLMKYVVFTESNLKGRIQLFRYAILVCSCILLNYIFLKFFVEWCGLFPTPSKIITAALVAIFSYVSQRNFTFKVKQEEEVA